MVSNTETLEVVSTKPQSNSRLEEAFASAKKHGEAALVTFVTAGYPTNEGKSFLFEDSLGSLSFATTVS